MSQWSAAAWERSVVQRKSEMDFHCQRSRRDDNGDDTASCLQYDVMILIPRAAFQKVTKHKHFSAKTKASQSKHTLLLWPRQINKCEYWNFGPPTKEKSWFHTNWIRLSVKTLIYSIYKKNIFFASTVSSSVYYLKVGIYGQRCIIKYLSGRTIW